MIDLELLKILCCPESHQPLAEAEAELVASINARIQAGQARNRAGQLVQEPMESGLVRSDRQYLYPIRRGIPVLLVEEALPLQAKPPAPQRDGKP